jgi:hypothetical protein
MHALDGASTDSVENFLDMHGFGKSASIRNQLLKAIHNDGWKYYRKAPKNTKMQHLKVVRRDP